MELDILFIAYSIGGWNFVKVIDPWMLSSYKNLQLRAAQSLTKISKSTLATTSTPRNVCPPKRFLSSCYINLLLICIGYQLIIPY